jgi:hypothetical protein
MKAFQTIATLLYCIVFILFSPQNLTAQLEFSLQYLEDTEEWGVFVKPLGSISPSNNTITAGGGQVTLVTPIDFELGAHTSINGKWNQNSQVVGPDENPERKYIFFGFVSDNPPLVLEPSEASPLFTFPKLGDCPDTLSIIDENDPFMVVPNSAGVNPGNSLAIFDVGAGGQQYFYSGNYDLEGWNCNPATTSIVELNSDLPTLEVFPNPFNETFEVHFSEEFSQQNLQLELFDLSGKEILKTTLSKDGNNKIGKDLRKGFYIYKIQNEKGEDLYSGKIYKKG